MINEIKDDELMGVETFDNTLEMFKTPELQTVCDQLGVNWMEGIEVGN